MTFICAAVIAAPLVAVVAGIAAAIHDGAVMGRFE